MLSSIKILTIILLLGACVPAQNEAPNLPDPALIVQWHEQAINTFTTSPHNLKEFAASLQNYASTQTNKVNLELENHVNDIEFSDLLANVLTPIDKTNNTVSTNTTNNVQGMHPAVLEAKLKRIQMLIAHQNTFYGATFVSEHDRDFINKTPKWSSYEKSLQDLINTNKVLKRGQITVYEANTHDQLLAYEKRYENSRAYIAFNFSYDVVEFPFPFGFMASTKITTWSTDATTPETYVTNSKIMIRGLSASIVIVE